MKDILWKPKSPEKSQMSQLIQIINESYKEDINSYNELHQWSVENVSEFWEEVWKYSKIIHSKAFLKVVEEEAPSRNFILYFIVLRIIKKLVIILGPSAYFL